MNMQALEFATQVLEGIRDGKIVSAGIETSFEEIDGKVTGYGDELTYTFVVKNVVENNEKEPESMEEFFEQRKGDWTFVEMYEFAQKLKGKPSTD